MKRQKTILWCGLLTGWTVWAAASFGQEKIPATDPSKGMAGAVEVWYRQILELRTSDRSRLELQQKLQALETERARLKTEQELRESDRKRLDREIHALREQVKEEAPGGAALWISLVETTLLSETAPPQSLPALTVVEGAGQAEGAPFVVNFSGRRFTATVADFAEERELLAHLKSNEAKMEEEARRLTDALVRVADDERAAWQAHIERLRRRADTLRRIQRETESAFAEWRAKPLKEAVKPAVP